MKWSAGFIKAIMMLAGIALIILPFLYYKPILLLTVIIGVFLMLYPFNGKRETTKAGMIICQKCGNESLSDVDFCGNCGKAVSSFGDTKTFYRNIIKQPSTVPRQ